MDNWESEVVFDSSCIPENGVVFTLDDDKVGLWMLGNLRKSTEVAGLALYRLISHFNGNGDKISKAVDGIVGRIH